MKRSHALGSSLHRRGRHRAGDRVLPGARTPAPRAPARGLGFITLGAAAAASRSAATALRSSRDCPRLRLCGVSDAYSAARRRRRAFSAACLWRLAAWAGAAAVRGRRCSTPAAGAGRMADDSSECLAAPPASSGRWTSTGSGINTTTLTDSTNTAAREVGTIQLRAKGLWATRAVCATARRARARIRASRLAGPVARLAPPVQARQRGVALEVLLQQLVVAFFRTHARPSTPRATSTARSGTGFSRFPGRRRIFPRLSPGPGRLPRGAGRHPVAPPAAWQAEACNRAACWLEDSRRCGSSSGLAAGSTSDSSPSRD